MSLIESYMPDYVLRLQAIPHACGCAGCFNASPLVQLRWKNQVRHSAVLSCDSAAREILCHDKFLQLHIGEAIAENLPPLCSELRAVNQCCLQLLTVNQADPCFFLFQLGRFLTKMQQRQKGKSGLTLMDELLHPGQQRQSAAEFSEGKNGAGCKMAALRTLGQLNIQANIAGHYSEALSRQLSILALSSDDCLQHHLRSLQQQSLGWQALPRILANFLGYELYHNVFPGSNSAEWQFAFADLCQHFFQLKMLCALCMQLNVPLDTVNISALFAGWQRARPQRVFTANPAVFGIALLK